MGSKRLVLTAAHETGSLCVMTFEEDGRGLQANLSFRNQQGLDLPSVTDWRASLSDWARRLCKGAVDTPLPPGWSL